MATTKFNNILLAGARRLKDARTDPTPNGDANARYTSVQLTEYANRSVRDYLVAKLVELGPDGFADKYPEYIKTSGVLTLAAGAVAKPADAIVVADLMLSDLSKTFSRIAQGRVANVKVGKDALIIPSATKPVFWEEGSNVNTLGILAGNVIARYIVTHQDILPSTAPVGNGNFNSASGGWVAATRTLSAPMNVAFVVGDVNKNVMFRSATVTYSGKIDSRTTPSDVVLSGYNLPAVDIAAPGVVQVIVSDQGPDPADLLLNDNWHSEIINRIVQYGLADAKANAA